MAFPRSLHCLIILNAIRVIILLDSFHFFFLTDKEIGNTTCTDEDQDGKREKKKTRFSKFAMAHCAKYTMFEPRNFNKHCFLFFLGRLSYLKEIEDNCYAKFWGCKQDLLWAIPNWRIGWHSFSCSFFVGGLKVQLLLNHWGKRSTLETSGNFPCFSTHILVNVTIHYIS